MFNLISVQTQTVTFAIKPDAESSTPSTCTFTLLPPHPRICGGGQSEQPGRVNAVSGVFPVQVYASLPTVAMLGLPAGVWHAGVNGRGRSPGPLPVTPSVAHPAHIRHYYSVTGVTRHSLHVLTQHSSSRAKRLTAQPGSRAWSGSLGTWAPDMSPPCFCCSVCRAAGDPA